MSGETFPSRPLPQKITVARALHAALAVAMGIVPFMRTRQDWKAMQPRHRTTRHGLNILPYSTVEMARRLMAGQTPAIIGKRSARRNRHKLAA